MLILKINPVRNRKFLNGVNQRNFKEIVKIAVQSIKQGKVIVCPTDTIYGLIANVANKKAVERIFKIKKRSKKKPYPIFIKDLKQAKKIARIDKKQEKFLKRVWPGEITAVLKRKKIKTNLYGVDKKTIAFRIPKYKFIIELIKKTGCPLIETSVNISNQPPITKIEDILNHFKKRKHQPDLIVNAGNLPKIKPSTVLDLTVSPPKILRK